VLIVALACMSLSGALLVLAHVSTNGTSGPLVEAGFGALVLLGLSLLVLYLRDRPEVSEEGISAPGLWPAPRSMRWKDVTYLGFDRPMGWFVVRDGGGRTVYVSAILSGLAQFARLAARHVPQSAFTPGVAQSLQLLADHPIRPEGGT
jgi:hypothetical protein